MPCSVVHIDFSGSLDEHNYIVVDDAATGGLKLDITSTTAREVLETLRSLFATFGTPKLAGTDNDTAFVAQETSDFVTSSGVRYVTSATYHPAMNERAYRMVQEMKVALRKLGQGSELYRLFRSLFRQHATSP